MEDRPTFGPATPVIPAADVERSFAFYVETLGFKEAFRYGSPLEYAGVRRGLAAVHIFACSEPKIAEWTAFRVRVHDLESLHARCEAAGVIHPNGAIGKRPWGTREFAAVDPAGVCITFWQEA